MNNNDRLEAECSYIFEFERDGKIFAREEIHNVVPYEMINHLLNVGYHGLAQITTWYLGLYEGNYTPSSADTAAGFPAAATECTAYNEATRVAWDPADAGAVNQVITSESGTGATKATFTFNATKTIYGGFMSSASAKGAITGVLASACRKAASQVVQPGDKLHVAYRVSLASV